MHFFVFILHANTNTNGAANKLLFILVKNRLSTQSCAKYTYLCDRYHQ